jgi:hypothetical protein
MPLGSNSPAALGCRDLIRCGTLTREAEAVSGPITEIVHLSGHDLK